MGLRWEVQLDSYYEHEAFVIMSISTQEGKLKCIQEGHLVGLVEIFDKERIESQDARLRGSFSTEVRRKQNHPVEEFENRILPVAGLGPVLGSESQRLDSEKPGPFFVFAMFHQHECTKSKMQRIQKLWSKELLF